MKTRKALAFILALVMLSSLFVGTAAAAPVVGDYTLTGGDVTVDGTADKTVDVLFTSVNGGNYYAFQADWAKKETGETSYLTLSALTAGGTASPMENDPNTGRTYWTDGTFSAPITVTAGQPVWKATYTVAKDTPTGTYTVSVDVQAIVDTSYDGAMLGTYTATINVTNNGGSDPNPPTPEVPKGYSVAAKGDASINVGATADVALNVTHDKNDSYNAYYFVVSYNKDVLTYAGEAANGIKVDAEKGELTIAGYGEDKNSGSTAVTLTFTGKAAGEGKVTITAANIDAKENANVQNAPAATITTATATITVGGYSVTLPKGFTGEASAKAGENYTFNGGDDHGCYDVTATMGGTETTVTNNGDGSFTISNVTGEIVVTATPKSYDVTVDGTGKGDVKLPSAKPTYKTDYIFTVNKDAGNTYDVKASVNGTDINVTETADGCKISGADIKGDITITVNKTPISTGTTTITITAPAGVLKGSDSQTATNGQEYTIEINREDGYNYTAKLGDGTELDADTNGNFVIPADKINGTALTVTVTKTAVNPYEVEVTEYVKLDKTVMWLVTAKTEAGKALAYGTEGTMFYSEKYTANCWLVISAESEDTVKAAAIAAITESTEKAANVDYSGNANQTGTTDVNDAQFVYNVYKAVYESFEAASRAQLLAADVNGDKTVNVSDAAAIVSIILK